MEGFYAILGLNIDISKHRPVLQRYERDIVTMGDIEQAVQAADAIRLTGSYVTYKSRFLIPAPFSPTILAFIDVVNDELRDLRSIIATVCWPPTQSLNSSTSHSNIFTPALLKAIITLTSSDVLKLGPVFQNLDWVKSSSVDKQTSQSALLLDELQQCYSRYESSAFLAKLLMRCRQAFVNSLLSELSYGRYLTPPADNVIDKNCLFEIHTVKYAPLTSVSKSSLPVFLINIYVPLLCCTDLLNMLVRNRYNRLSKNINFNTDNTSCSEESVTDSTYPEENSFVEDMSIKLNKAPEPSSIEEQIDTFTFYDTVGCSDVTGVLHLLLYEVSDTILKFQQDVLPTLFKKSAWPLADVERVRDLIVSINRQLSDSLAAEREQICSWLGLLFLQTRDAGNFIHATAKLAEYTLETIELSSHLALDSTLLNRSQANNIINEKLCTESWFEVRVPLEFVSRMHSIMSHRRLLKSYAEDCNSPNPTLFERIFSKKFRKVYKRIITATENKELLRGDYVLLDPLDAVMLLVFGAIHSHIIEEEFTSERAKYFLGEHSQTRIANLSYMCRLSQFTNTTLNCVITMVSRLEKELGKQEFKGYNTHISHNSSYGLVIDDPEENAQRESFLAIRTINARRTCISPLFPGINRVLHLMAQFVISHNTYLSGVSMEPLRTGGLLGNGNSGDLAAMLREAHTRGIITHSIKALIGDMLYCCLRACYVIALLCKLSVSFSKYGRLFTYILQDCRELELQFLGMWETLLKNLSTTEQRQGIDTSRSMLMTWLPDLKIPSDRLVPIGYAKTQYGDTTEVHNTLTDCTSKLTKNSDQTKETKNLFTLRLGAALGLKK